MDHNQRLELISEFFKDRGIIPPHIIDEKIKSWAFKFKQLEQNARPFGKYFDLATEANSWILEDDDVRREFLLMCQITQDGAVAPELDNTLVNYWAKMIDVCPNVWYEPEEKRAALHALERMHDSGNWATRELWVGYIFPSKTRRTPFVSVFQNLVLFISTGQVNGRGNEYCTDFRPPLDVWDSVVRSSKQRWAQSGFEITN